MKNTSLETHVRSLNEIVDPTQKAIDILTGFGFAVDFRSSAFIRVCFNTIIGIHIHYIRIRPTITTPRI